MSRSLIAFDTDRIKEYVFASGALRDIRGASSILDQLNREALSDLVGGELIFAAGGSALFRVPSTEAESVITRVRQAYAEASGGVATITGVALPLPDGFNPQTDDIRPYWRLLGDRLATAKSRTPPFLASPSHPLIRYDAVDDWQYASESDRDDGLISRATKLKRERNDTIREVETLPESFEQIAEFSHPSGYFALVVADGDSMGRLLESCRTLAVIGQTATSLFDLLSTTVEGALHGIPRNRCDRLILGGDDIVLAVPAQYGLPVALHLVEEFGRRSEAVVGQALSLSAAVVWAHTRYPFEIWRTIAESALRFAKRGAALRRLPGGLINFLVIASANHLEFGDYYGKVLTTKDETYQRRLLRTMRPYSPADLRVLMDARTGSLADIPRSKLAALNRAIFQPSSRQAILDALQTLVHWRGAQSREAVVNLVAKLTRSPRRDLSFPFALDHETDLQTGRVRETYQTPLADLIELWDFLPGGSNATM